MQYFYIDISNLKHETISKLVGTDDVNLKLLEDLYKTDIVVRDNQIKFLSTDEGLFSKFKSQIEVLINHDDYNLETVKQTFMNEDISWKGLILGYTASGKPIKAKTYNQYLMTDYIKKNELVFSIGPAGTGKTYLAVLMAIKAYKEGQVKKIILTRPAVEAGESLGFLPGDLKEKIDPYLMPLYDALYEIMGQESTEKLIEKGVIEVLPLAYMRGRTLNEAFIILDEAQNTTANQMLMFLTRLGYDSKMVVNGDITQIDLNIQKNKSGLIVALDKLKKLNKIKFVEFNNDDIIRNPLVQVIIENFN